MAVLNFSAKMASPAVYPSRNTFRQTPPLLGLVGHSGTELLVKVHRTTDSASTPERLRVPPRQAAFTQPGT